MQNCRDSKNIRDLGVGSINRKNTEDFRSGKYSVQYIMMDTAHCTIQNT